MTDKERYELIKNYAWRCVDDMDIKDIRRELAESKAYEFETETDEYVIELVKDVYPDLIES